MADGLLFSSNICTKYPERPAIVGKGFSYSYSEVLHSINAFSRILTDKGIGKGTNVALWGFNSANWLIDFFAVVRAGGTAVLLNYSAALNDAAELLNMTKTKYLIFGDNARTIKDPEAISSLMRMTSIPEENCIDIRNSAVDLCKSLTDSPEGPETRTGDEYNETAVIIFTSGTTSLPKAVQNSQRAITTNSNAFLAGIGEHAGNSICVAVPLFHILGLLMSYSYLRIGATVCLPSDYKPQTIAEQIGTHKVSDMAAVGAIYLGLAEYEGFQESVVPNAKLCMIAGGMSTPVQMMRLELEFANAIFINMYGQSEAAPISMVRPSDLVEKRAQTVGRPVETLDVRFYDPKKGFLEKGEVGEIVAKGPGLMNGYFGLPKEKQPIDDQGWLHTGDLGYLDDDGFIHLAGRIKDIIIRGGENISPSEIESALNQIPTIKEAKVMGAPHQIYGESVEACAIPFDSSAPFDPEEIKEELKAKLARYKIPSHIFKYDRFPLNENGKIDQRSLYANMLSKLKLLNIEDELQGGIVVFDITVKNSNYAIVPVTSLIEELAKDIGFSPKKAASIRLAVEEMLTERIQDSYAGVGNIRIKVSLMSDWLRVSFSDTGTEYCIDKRLDTSLSAKIILAAVDNFHTDRLSGKPIYCMDFLYQSEVKITDFLMRE